MAPKRNVRDSTPSSTATAQSSGTSTPIPITSKPKQNSNLAPQEIAFGVWQDYLDNTPQRTKLIDVFMLFLVVVGGLQFAHCLISGNYVCAPMNAP
jgi:oligosaccharyltransferase complex subunit epsilon